MLGSTAGMAASQPGLSAAFSSVLRRAVRGLAEQSEGRLFLRVPEADEAAQAILENSLPAPPIRRFIASPDLARTVVSRLGFSRDPETIGRRPPIVLECEPGPGLLTRTLLNAGSQVIALESSNAFLPGLKSLKKKLDGQLEVVHCDFFKLDPIEFGSVRPPIMYSETLFENLSILPVPWTGDIPLKVVGIVPQKKERNLLWKLLYALYECSSVYKYGRTELNLFVSEKEYKTLTAKAGEPRLYQAISVLWQTACDIQLLHMEPWSSFLTNSRNGKLSIPKSKVLQNDHLCLIRMTPRKNLFTDSLTPTNSSKFILIVKQWLGKSKTVLVDKLNLWTSNRGRNLLRRLEIPENVTTGNLYPEEYKRLFEAMEQSNEFDQSWLYDSSLENNRSIIF